MRVVVPYDARRPKTRLSGVLDDGERRTFARALLADVLSTLRAVDGARPELLATAPVEADVPVIVDERPLTPAVNDALDPPTAVVMADLGLATPAAVERLLSAEGDVVLVPGRGGGTNAVVSRDPEFVVDYHGASYRDHRQIADDLGATVGTVDSYRLSTDVDEPDDLPEVLLHGRERARKWLRTRGFRIAVEGGRVTVVREGDATGDRTGVGPDG